VAVIGYTRNVINAVTIIMRFKGKLIMFKYDLKQVVWYFRDNIVHSAPVLSRRYVDNVHSARTEAQKEIFNGLGPTGITYKTIHDVYSEGDLYPTKEDLMGSLGF